MNTHCKTALTDAALVLSRALPGQQVRAASDCYPSGSGEWPDRGSGRWPGRPAAPQSNRYGAFLRAGSSSTPPLARVTSASAMPSSDSTS
jgi:hypothetical protein